METLSGQKESSGLVETLARLLGRANYERFSDKGLQRALKLSPLFQVRLYVDLDDFEKVLLYARGASRREETLKEFFGLWRRKVIFTNYDRVLMYIRLKSDMDSESALGDC